MTNETVEVTGAIAETTEKIQNLVANQTQEAAGVFEAIKNWLVVNGLDFAVNLIAALLILLIGYAVIRIIKKMAESALNRTGKLNPLLSTFLLSTLGKLLWVVLFMVILRKLGVDITPLIAGLGVTGFILGFAFQESLGNLASGLMIAINQPFKIGDYVELAGNAGSIRELNMMATTLTTPDNKQIVIPNKVAWGAPIINYSTQALRRVDLRLSVAYGSDLDRVKQLLAGLVDSKSYVEKNPGATIEVIALSAPAVDFVVRPWVKNADYWTAFFELTREIKALLEKEGISAPLPQMGVVQIAQK